MNPNNCHSCKHIKQPDKTLHCYMFKDEPTEICFQHSYREDERREFGKALLNLCQPQHKEVNNV